jgi:uncharacterized membrane protein YccF (DUF307 family)
MTLIGNILWFILCGLWMAILYGIAGLLALILIVTIPLGVQAFKLAGYVIWPFGRYVVSQPGASPVWTIVGNVIWVILIGWWLALAHVIAALIFFITIIGIPFGVANLKLARLALLPFGFEVSSTPEAQPVLYVPQLGTSSVAPVTSAATAAAAPTTLTAPAAPPVPPPPSTVPPPPPTPPSAPPDGPAAPPEVTGPSSAP